MGFPAWSLDPFSNLQSHVRNAWVAHRTAEYSHQPFLLLASLDICVLLQQQTLSSVVAVQGWAAAHLGCGHCSHLPLQNQREYGNLFHICSTVTKSRSQAANQDPVFIQTISLGLILSGKTGYSLSGIYICLFCVAEGIHRPNG